jgi:two-component system, chemotaxis family, sensor kinase Cph1
MSDTTCNECSLSSKIDLGNHVCSIYKNREQQFAQLIPFFIDGLKSNQKCVYVTDENTPEEVIAQFKNAGHDISPYLSSKQFQILNVEQTYQKDGVFNPDVMVAFVKEMGKDALKEGYVGLRGAGEMSWALNKLSNMELLIEYENKLYEAIKNSKIALVCQYNENKFSPKILINIIRTHPINIIYGKAYENIYLFTPPKYLKKNQDIFSADSYKTIIDTVTGQ